MWPDIAQWSEYKNKAITKTDIKANNALFKFTEVKLNTDL